MGNKFKDLNMKNCTYYFFNDIINIKNFNPNNIKKKKKSNKNILIYYIGDVTIKYSKYVKINSVNLSVYLVYSKVNGHFERINGNEYLKLVPTN